MKSKKPTRLVAPPPQLWSVGTCSRGWMAARWNDRSGLPTFAFADREDAQRKADELNALEPIEWVCPPPKASTRLPRPCAPVATTIHAGGVTITIEGAV